MKLPARFRQRTPSQLQQGLFIPAQVQQYDPTISYQFFDDFVGIDVNSTTTTATLISAFFSRIIVGAGAFVQHASPTNEMTGGIQIATGGAGTQGGICNAGNGTKQVRPALGAITLEARIEAGALSTGANEGIVSCGLQDGFLGGTARTANNVISFCYDFTVGINWLCCVRTAGGALAQIDTGIPYVTNTIYKLKIQTDPANTVATFYINGVVVGTVNQALPFANGIQTVFSIFKNAGVTFKAFNVDFVNFYQRFNSAWR